MKRVLIIYHAGKPSAAQAAEQARHWLESHNCPVSLVDQQEAARWESLPSPTPDLVVCLGGDGTLLTGAWLAAPANIPVLGAHLGRFGFIAQIRPENLQSALQSWFQDECQIQERLMIQARVDHEPNAIYGLNEIAMLRAPTAPMLTFGIRINGRELTSYPADGTLVSTSTGSTGYALSTGAPVMHPEVQAMILAAISPHTLGARPLVLPPSATVSITIEPHPNEDVGSAIDRQEALLTADGNRHRVVAPGQVVEITQSPYKTRLLVFNEGDFLEKLRNRLLWGARVNE